MRKIAALLFIAGIVVSGCKKDENMLVGSWTVHQIEAITNSAANRMIAGDTVAHSTYRYAVEYSADDSLYTQSQKRFYASDTAVELQSWDTAAYTLSSTLVIRSDGTFKMTNAYLFLYQRHESLDTSYTISEYWSRTDEFEDTYVYDGDQLMFLGNSTLSGKSFTVTSSSKDIVLDYHYHSKSTETADTVTYNSSTTFDEKWVLR